MAWTIVLPVVDEIWYLKLLWENLLLKFSFGLMIKLEISFIIFDDIQKIIIVNCIAYCKIFRNCR